MSIYERLDAWDAAVDQWQEFIIEKLVFTFTHHTILCAAIGVIFLLIIILIFLIAENQRLTEQMFKEIERRWDERGKDER